MSNPLLEFAPPPCRELVKDGKWLMPESERPANWREILPEDRESVPPPKPDRAVPGMTHRTIVTRPKSTPVVWTEHRKR